ncbi:MAG: transcriptional regulator [Xanthomonadaceae bacterium]|nr:transcriptional regulator [Xanthomonadaceae bacterium]
MNDPRPMVEAEAVRDPLLVALGSRVRGLRARRGITRRQLAQLADVSERHLANLEAGDGNPSVLILAQVARALGSPIAELLGDETTDSPDWLLIRDLLHDRSPAELALARTRLTELFGAAPAAAAARAQRIALVGLRGAGKSTLGRLLAAELGTPFVELNREIERIAGAKPEQIHTLYGPAAYRRYERRALDETLKLHPAVVIATPGGIVSEAATFNVLLACCRTVWLTAAPEEHMDRVVAQGDLRPMSGNREAMADLKLILAERTPFYAKADLRFDTSGKSLAQSLAELRAALTASRS